MQKLEVFQSLWAMERRQPDGVELSLPEIFEKVAGGGYDGIGIDTGTNDEATVNAARPLFAEYGLASLVTAFPDSVDAMRRVLDMAASVDARLVCVNAKVFPFTPAEGAEFVNHCLELGHDYDIPVYFDTHRLTLTTDLLYTLQLIELVPELELVCDLSHYVVARELPEPIDVFWQGLIEQILDRGAGFQGRVATREQAQVPIHWPQHQYWYELFCQWWTQGFEKWRARKPDDATLNFLCELGPQPYALTGPDGFDLTDRWSEAQDIKTRVRDIWTDIEQKSSGA